MREGYLSTDMGLFSKLKTVLSRQRVRYHYNKKNWKKAKKLARIELIQNRNIDFSNDIILRSHWNLGEYQEVIVHIGEHPEIDEQHYLQRAKNIISVSKWTAEPLPEEVQSAVFNLENVRENWFQEDQRLWFRHPKGAVHWDMPTGYKLDDTHDALLELATQLLLGPFIPKVKTIRTKKRVPGKHRALAYSGGVDSTAAYLMMPESTILAYHQRTFPSNLKHGNALQAISFIRDQMNRPVHIFPSNHELIRTDYGMEAGFSTSYAAGIHLILAADFFDLGALSFGTVVENTWLEKGVRFRDFANSWHWKYWPKRFLHAGLCLDLPINHLTEACTMRVCMESTIGEVVNSCIRQDDGGCGICWKCFHKNGPMGRSMNPKSREIQMKLKQPPLRSGMHALWALQKQNLTHLAPQYAEILNQDLTWWGSFYPPGLSIISDDLQPYISEKTGQFLEHMPTPYSIELIDMTE